MPKESAEAEAAQYISQGRKALEANKLGTPEAEARQANFESRTGLPLGSAWQSPMFGNVDTGQYVANPNTQYTSPESIKMREAMKSVGQMQAAPRNSALGARGITPSTRPAMGFSGDNLDVNNAAPQSPLAQPAPVQPLVQPEVRPAAAQWQGPPSPPMRTAFGTAPITDMEFWNNISKKLGKLAPKGSAANP